MQPHRDSNYWQQPTERPMWIEAPRVRISPGLVVFLAIMFLLLLVDTALLVYVFLFVQSVVSGLHQVSSIFGG